MKKTVRTGFFLLAFAGVSILNSCQKEKDDVFSDPQNIVSSTSSTLKSQSLNTFYGPTVPMGGGVARAWVSVTKDGNPVSAGVNLSEKAIEKLPADPAQYVLMFPETKGTNFYKHVLLDWNPNGHEPNGIYNVPHFDVHFYIISSEERMAIGPNDLAQFANAPAPQYDPPMYLQLPGGVPGMGAHWADLLAPEFNGGSFTKTFIWGSYDGKFIFWEPMITLAYLQSHPDETTITRQPSAYEVDGWYAESYRVAWSEKQKQYTVALTDLVHRSAE